MKAKVKTLRFVGSETKFLGRDKGHRNVQDDTEEIDCVVNQFIKDNVTELIDIKVTTVDCLYHNNGGYNKVDLIYTIIYR